MERGKHYSLLRTLVPPHMGGRSDQLPGEGEEGKRERERERERGKEGGEGRGGREGGSNLFLDRVLLTNLSIKQEALQLIR